jgi:hypothetical protein
MSKDGRKNQGGIGDLMSPLRALGLDDGATNYLGQMHRRDSVLAAFWDAIRGNIGPMKSHLQSAGLDEKSAHGVAEYLRDHHKFIVKSLPNE